MDRRQWEREALGRRDKTEGETCGKKAMGKRGPWQEGQDGRGNVWKIRNGKERHCASGTTWKGKQTYRRQWEREALCKRYNMEGETDGQKAIRKRGTVQKGQDERRNGWKEGNRKERPLAGGTRRKGKCVERRQWEREALGRRDKMKGETDGKKAMGEALGRRDKTEGETCGKKAMGKRGPWQEGQDGRGNVWKERNGKERHCARGTTWKGKQMDKRQWEKRHWAGGTTWKGKRMDRRQWEREALGRRVKNELQPRIECGEKK
eukprot:gene4361-20583_t